MRHLLDSTLLRWIGRTVREVWREMSEDRIGDLAASMSFFALLAIPASVLALVTGMGSLEGIIGADLAADTQRVVTDYVEDTFGSEALTDTVSGLFEQQRSGILTVSIVVALYSISRSFAGLVRALDVAYDLDTKRSWFDVRLTGLSLGIGTLGVAGLGIYFLLAAPSAGPFATVVTPLLLIAGFGAWMATVFHIAPDHHTPWRYDLPGAALTSVIWAILLQGYTVYVRVIEGGNGAVGIVGAALLAFTLVYLLSMTLLIGAELNALICARAGIAQPARRLHHLVKPKRQGAKFTHHTRNRH